MKLLSRLIPTPVHGVLDYIVGAFLVAAPYLFHWNPKKPAGTVPMLLGAATVAYSLLTDYEAGIFKLIAMPVHLWIDLSSGILLALSPWLFAFANKTWLGHLVLGLVEIAVVLLSDARPYRQIDSRRFTPQ